MKYFATLLFLLFLGCQQNSRQNQLPENNISTPEPQTTVQETEFPINEPEPVIIDSVYLIHTGLGDFYGWAPLKYEPNDKSIEGSSINLGGRLYVIEEKGDWLKVWAELRKDRAGNYIYTNERVFGSLYIRKELTGEFEQLFVSEEELPLIIDSGKERSISEDTLSFRLITKDEYLTQKATAISHILYDTLNIKETDGKLTLPCTEKTVILTNIDNDSDDCRYYTYIGQIPLLNVYLIKGRYFESGNYFFIDKDTGKRTDSFGDFPFISPDGKYVANMWGNIYESYTEFVFSKLKEDNTSENLFYHNFTKWMPFNCAYDKEIDYFWGNDNQLYVKIQTARLAGQIYEDYAAQYIRISIGIMNT